MLLQNKTAIIYGAGGAVGSVVATAFAKEGAHVFLAGRTIDVLEAVATTIRQQGGKATASVADALNKHAVEKHLQEVVQQTGRVDISFNVIGLEDEHGMPLTTIAQQQFVLPIVNAMNSHFITATVAARYMQQQQSGVIMALTANASRTPFENLGGFGVACAAIEAFCRQLAVEEGRHGIRVVCLRSAGSPDAPGVDKVFHLHAANEGITRQAFEDNLAQRTMLKRLPRLKEIAEAAVLMASDKASAITAAIINVTCGEIAD